MIEPTPSPTFLTHLNIQHNFSVAGGLRKLISSSYMSSFADSNLLLPFLLKHYVYPAIVAVAETIEPPVPLCLLLCHL